MAGVLSESLANYVLPVEGLLDNVERAQEDIGDEHSFIFKPPDGAEQLKDLVLNKETLLLLIGALTHSSPKDANMALGVVLKEKLDKHALETLCLRLFSACKQLHSQKVESAAKQAVAHTERAKLLTTSRSSSSRERQHGRDDDSPSSKISRGPEDLHDKHTQSSMTRQQSEPMYHRPPPAVSTPKVSSPVTATHSTSTPVTATRGRDPAQRVVRSVQRDTSHPVLHGGGHGDDLIGVNTTSPSPPCPTYYMRQGGKEGRKDSRGELIQSQEDLNVWNRLSRPVGHTHTPRPMTEFANSLLSEGVNPFSQTAPPDDEFVPKKPIFKTEEEAKEIFDRLYFDAARWKVRRRVYTELALMTEDAKIAKECPFQPAVRNGSGKKPTSDLGSNVSQRLYEESKKRLSRRKDLVEQAPLPSFRPETSRGPVGVRTSFVDATHWDEEGVRTSNSSGYKAQDEEGIHMSRKTLHKRLHEDAARYRELRQSLDDYQLGPCTFKPDTSRSMSSGPTVNLTQPIWCRGVKKFQKETKQEPSWMTKKPKKNGSSASGSRAGSKQLPAGHGDDERQTRSGKNTTTTAGGTEADSRGDTAATTTRGRNNTARESDGDPTTGRSRSLGEKHTSGEPRHELEEKAHGTREKNGEQGASSPQVGTSGQQWTDQRSEDMLTLESDCSPKRGIHSDGDVDTPAHIEGILHQTSDIEVSSAKLSKQGAFMSDYHYQNSHNAASGTEILGAVGSSTNDNNINTSLNGSKSESREQSAQSGYLGDTVQKTMSASILPQPSHDQLEHQKYFSQQRQQSYKLAQPPDPQNFCTVQTTGSVNIYRGNPPVMSSTSTPQVTPTLSSRVTSFGWNPWTQSANSKISTTAVPQQLKLISNIQPVSKTVMPQVILHQ